MDFADLVCFVKIVEKGSLTAAAETLGWSRTQVTRSLQKIECEGNVSLIQRTTRKLRLTQRGEVFYSDALAAVRAYETAKHRLEAELVFSPRLRVACGFDFYVAVVGKYVHEFSLKYPDICLDIILDNTVRDLFDANVDVAIRVGAQNRGAGKIRKLGVFTYGLMAAPKYLEQVGPITNPSELQRCRALVFSHWPNANHWFLRRDQEELSLEMRDFHSVNSIVECRRAAGASLGVAYLPIFLQEFSEESGNVMRILPDWIGFTSPVYAIYPVQKYAERTLRILLDFLYSCFSRDSRFS